MRRPRVPATGTAVTFAVVCGLAFVGWLIWTVVSLAGQLDDAIEALGTANDRLVSEGLKPVAPPVPGEPGTAGEPGQEGRPPTTAEILGAVTAYCADNACRGPAGSGVTPAQVATAVATYCNDRGECRGPRGGNGDDGRDGTDGAPGPPPTAAQIADAVDTFCADGRCRGPVGPPGPQGPPGTGIQGPPGPTCPDGFTPQQRTIITDDGPEQAMICVAG